MGRRYRGQILVLTYPMIGNYGVPTFEEKDAFGLPAYFESKDVQIAGLVVSSYSEDPSHWASARSLGAWLQAAGVPAIAGVDTRLLTKRIRVEGALLGRLDVAGAPVVEGFEDPNLRHLVAEVSTKEVTRYGAGNSPTIVALDCGMKFNIVRYMVETHGVEMVVVPHDYDLAANPANIAWDGVFCSNGPGDPARCGATIASLKWAIAQDKPVFGICLGNQILALAAGAKTYKMKYGNRGAPRGKRKRARPSDDIFYESPSSERGAVRSARSPLCSTRSPEVSRTRPLSPEIRSPRPVTF